MSEYKYCATKLPKADGASKKSTPKGEAAPEEHNLSFIQLANEAKEPESDRRIDGVKKKEPSASRRRLLRIFTPPAASNTPPTLHHPPLPSRRERSPMEEVGGGGRDLMGGDLRGRRQQLASVLQEECEAPRSNSALHPLVCFSLPANQKFRFSADSKKMADFQLALACWDVLFRSPSVRFICSPGSGQIGGNRLRGCDIRRDHAMQIKGK